MKHFIKEDKTLERLAALGAEKNKTSKEVEIEKTKELKNKLEEVTNKGLKDAVRLLQESITFGAAAFGMHPTYEKMCKYGEAEAYFRKTFEVAPRFTLHYLEKTKFKSPFEKALTLTKILGHSKNKSDRCIAFKTIRKYFDKIDISKIKHQERDIYLLKIGCFKDIKNPEIKELRGYLNQKFKKR